MRIIRGIMPRRGLAESSCHTRSLVLSSACARKQQKQASRVCWEGDAPSPPRRCAPPIPNWGGARARAAPARFSIFGPAGSSSEPLGGQVPAPLEDQVPLSLVPIRHSRVRRGATALPTTPGPSQTAHWEGVALVGLCRERDHGCEKLGRAGVRTVGGRQRWHGPSEVALLILVLLLLGEVRCHFPVRAARGLSGQLAERTQTLRVRAGMPRSDDIESVLACACAHNWRAFMRAHLARRAAGLMVGARQHSTLQPHDRPDFTHSSS